MPIVSEIATTAHFYRRNEAVLAKSIEGLTTEEWQSRPNDTSNSVLWIVGHCVWSRSLVLKFLGSSWDRPWLPLFARGSKAVESSRYPSPEEIMFGWKDVSENMTAAFEEASAEALSGPSPAKAPSFDGTLAGTLAFMAFHESYHAGQLAYLRCWLGHGGVAG